MRRLINNTMFRAAVIKERVKGALKVLVTSKKGEGYVDTGIKIIIAVVIGGLILAGLYALFNTTIIPTMKTKVSGFFDYAG